MRLALQSGGACALSQTACAWACRLHRAQRQRQRRLEFAAPQRAWRSGAPSRWCVRQARRRSRASLVHLAAAAHTQPLCSRKASACSASKAASTRRLCQRCARALRLRQPTAVCAGRAAGAHLPALCTRAARRARRQRRGFTTWSGCKLSARERATRVGWPRAARGEGGPSHCGAGARPTNAAGARSRAKACDMNDAQALDGCAGAVQDAEPRRV